MSKQTAYPSALNLPQGVAHLVVGSVVDATPRYLLDGEPIDVDVTIPDDLLAADWFWWGSFLHQQLTPDGCGISIDTGTFPPPGVLGGHPMTLKWTDDEGEPQVTVIEHATCFDAARKIEETRARLNVEREAEALKKAAKRPRRERQAKTAKVEATYEQSSF